MQESCVYKYKSSHYWLVLGVLPSQNRFRRTEWNSFVSNTNCSTPEPLCLWRVVQAERASSSWAALMANLKNFHSTTESCIAILNYR